MDRRDGIAITILIALMLLFFSPLFLPYPKVFYNPDYGRSDLWNYNYPMRLFLQESLRNWQLPLWNKDVGMGFPYFAEGQTDTFLFYHPILYFFLPTWLAFNLSFVAAFITAAVGMYLLARLLGFSRTTSILTALPFTFSAYLTVHISQNTIFPASLFPLLTYAVLRVYQTPTLKSFLLLSLVVSQLIFAGHLQFPFIGAVGVGILILAQMKGRTLRPIALLGLSFILGLALSAIQILPFLEFWKLSTRQQTFSFERATQLSMSLKDLTTLLYPTALGAPKDASYHLNTENVYWEKVGYVGLLPIISLLPVLFILKKRPLPWTFFILFIVSILLSMGRHSPVAFLFNLPPFSFLRGPSRYLVWTSLSLSILFGYVVAFIEGKIRHHPHGNRKWRKIVIMAVVFIIADLWFFAWNYLPTVSVQEALTPPETARFLQKYPGRIFHLGSEAPYLNHLLKNGWKDMDYYLYNKNALAANLHLLWNLSNVDAAYALATERYKLVDNTLKYQAFGDLERLIASSSALHKRILSLTSTRFLVSPFYFKDPDLRRVYTVNPSADGWPRFYIYENADVLPRFRFASAYEVAPTIELALKKFENGGFPYKDSVVLEDDPELKLKKGKKQEVEVVKDELQQLSLAVSSDVDNLLLIADSFYPGWKAYIDGKETKIYPANINQRAVIIPAGNHHLEMKFQPMSVYVGGMISGLSAVLWITLFVFVHPRGGIASHLRRFRQSISSSPSNDLGTSPASYTSPQFL